VKIERALVVARKARIRRHIPSGATAQDGTVATPPKWPVLRDARGCFVKGGGGGPGRPPRDALRDAYIADLFAVWKKTWSAGAASHETREALAAAETPLGRGVR
jgi:hypothetical protein